MLERSAKITDNFRYAIRSHSCTTTNQHLRCSKEGKRDTKEDKGKSMMHALYVATADGEKVPLRPNGEKNKPVALAIVELC